MGYRLLGSSGCAVSALALGTLTFGNETDEAGSFAQLDQFTEAGSTLIDSADVYADGRSEQASTGRFPTDETPNGHGLSRQHLTLALHASLRRLNVETIDLYQVRGWDPLTRVEETLRFLDDAVRAGKINYAGLSNFTGWQVHKAVDVAEARGLSAPVSLQPQYNLRIWNQRSQDEHTWQVDDAVRKIRAFTMCSPESLARRSQEGIHV